MPEEVRASKREAWTIARFASTNGEQVFKNLTVFRIGPEWSASVAQMEQSLDKARFVDCGASQPQSSGWVEPRGIEHAPLVESIGAHLLLRLKTERKLLPGSVVRRRTEEMLDQIEQASGRRPGKKQAREIKEQAVLELLPMAFTKQGSIDVWIDPKRHLLMIGSSSAGQAEEVVSALVKSL